MVCGHHVSSGPQNVAPESAVEGSIVGACVFNEVLFFISQLHEYVDVTY